MQKARARSFLHLTRMELLVSPWALHITLTLPLFLPISPSAPTYSHTQKNRFQIGQVLWMTLWLLVPQGERSMLEVILQNRQNLLQEEEIRVAILGLKGKEVWLEFLVRILKRYIRVAGQFFDLIAGEHQPYWTQMDSIDRRQYFPRV